MAKVSVERVGGLGGFGIPGSHIRSRGEIDTDSLSEAEQRKLEDLFVPRAGAKPSLARDTFRYRISRETPNGVETIEVPEEDVPSLVSQSVKDELV